MSEISGCMLSGVDSAYSILGGLPLFLGSRDAASAAGASKTATTAAADLASLSSGSTDAAGLLADSLYV